MFLDLAGALLGRAALCGKCNRSKTKFMKRIPFTSALVELFCIPYGLISDQISVGGMGKHKGGLFYKGRNYFDLVSLISSLLSWISTMYNAVHCTHRFQILHCKSAQQKEI